MFEINVSDRLAALSRAAQSENIHEIENEVTNLITSCQAVGATKMLQVAKAIANPSEYRDSALESLLVDLKAEFEVIKKELTATQKS